MSVASSGWLDGVTYLVLMRCMLCDSVLVVLVVETLQLVPSRLQSW